MYAIFLYYETVSRFQYLFWNISYVNKFQTSKPGDTCYELLEEWEGFRDNAKYALEGVGILVIGSIGLVSNVLSMFIFKRSKGNKNFHRLLIM